MGIVGILHMEAEVVVQLFGRYSYNSVQILHLLVPEPHQLPLVSSS